MKLVLEILPHNNEEHLIHRTIDKFPLTIGRSYNNDIILADPYVSPHHLRIDNGETWMLSDLNSVNGVYLNGVFQQNGSNLPIRSGDGVRIGQTELRFYEPHHAISPAIRIYKSHPLFSWLSSPLNVWACFMLALAVLMGWTFLEIWTEEPGMVLAAGAAGTVVTVLLWATLWSVGGRLISHKSYFREHAALISLYLVAGTLTWYIEAYTDFLTNENWFSTVVSYALNFLLLVPLLYASFALASRMTRQRQLVSSLFLSGSIMAGIFLLGIIGTKSFNQQPLYPFTLEPYLSWMAPTESVDKFMVNNNKLFSEKEFVSKPLGNAK